MPAWDDEAEKKLLMAVIQTTSGSAPNWKTIASMMGPDYSSGGVGKQYSRMKAKSYAQFDNTDSGEGNGTKTPVKKGASKKAAGETSGKRKAKKDVEEDDDEETKTLSKKVKVQEEPAKEESSDGDEI